ncbi:MAG: hypothetical protein RLZZ230_257 [Candidatus Parcubacteria bacterium]|jgi:hypothetical protein
MAISFLLVFILLLISAITLIVKLANRYPFFKMSLAVISVLMGLYFCAQFLTLGGLYSLQDGLRYTSSYNLDTREDIVAQAVYQSISLQTSGRSFGSFGPSWDKIYITVNKLQDSDIQILIRMLDGGAVNIGDADLPIEGSQGIHSDKYLTIAWILSRMNSESVIPQLEQATVGNDSFYIDYALMMTKESTAQQASPY